MPKLLQYVKVLDALRRPYLSNPLRTAIFIQNMAEKEPQTSDLESDEEQAKEGQYTVIYVYVYLFEPIRNNI